MLQQQELVQTRETLAARDAEIQDLQARLAELEQLQQQQQQLIQMKDSELAAAQQRLAQSAQPGQPAAEAEVAAGGGVPWLWIGLGLLLAALLAWWLSSRRRSAEPARRQGYGFASAPGQPTPARPTPAPRAAPLPPAPVADAPVAEAPVTEPPAATPEAPLPMDAAVSWRNAPAAATGGSPTWHAASDASSVASLNPAPAGQERIELARAYIDLGDVETARSLLQEVAVTGDADARGEAERLLRELA